jgi:L-rhamnose-H+ transport protein
MEFKDCLAFIIAAGLINGSFVIPIRYLKHSSHEKMWLYHSVISIAIMPWLFLLVVFPNAFAQYTALPLRDITFLVFGGTVFGLGQISFAYAIEKIGIALSFTVNLGLGLVIGSMFVVLERSALFTSQGYWVTAAVILILCSLILYYFAGREAKITQHDHKIYRLGWLLAIMAGVASGLQNITFVVVAFDLPSSSLNTDSYWVWPPFLLAASIPMFIGFLYRANKQPTTYITGKAFCLSFKNLALVTLMGLCFTGSLVLYSIGMSGLSHSQHIIGWPAFMVSIILASQCWGCVYQETKGIGAKKYLALLLSIVMLVIAISLLALKN